MPGPDSMLYLCKSCFDYIKQQGIFIDRGDIVGWDFFTIDFTADGEWHDLDLSSIVPEGAKWVLIKAFLKDNLINTSFSFRENGNVNVANGFSFFNQVANVSIKHDGFVRLDSNRIIEYRLPPYAITTAYVLVRGWTLA